MKTFVLDLLDRLSARVWKSGPIGKKTDFHDIQGLANLIAGIESARYYAKYMLQCKTFQNKNDLLPYALSNVTIPGIFSEFGVASGTTINHIARIARERQIHGFDGFVGWPENWRDGFPSGTLCRKNPRSLT